MRPRGRVRGRHDNPTASLNPNPTLTPTLTLTLTLTRYEAVPVLARVCKRWRAVANDPSWKPAVVAYGWGAARVAGVGRAAARPALL